VTTTNLELETYNVLTNGNNGYLDIRSDLSDASNSNMTKIDTWASNSMLLFSALGAAVSASLVPTTTFISNASASLVSASALTGSYAGRIENLYTYNGAGTLDYNNIPQIYTHLLIIGQAVINAASNYAFVGCDINGNATSSCYVAMNWTRAGSSTGDLAEFIGASAVGQILLSGAGGTLSSSYPVAPFIAFIPYYSANGGFYKTGAGLSAYFLADFRTGLFNGGTYLSASSIKRIRMFGSTTSSSRVNFLDGTYISIYGI
jgi:hypothetical protein